MSASNQEAVEEQLETVFVVRYSQPGGHSSLLGIHRNAETAIGRAREKVDKFIGDGGSTITSMEDYGVVWVSFKGDEILAVAEMEVEP